VIGKRAIGVNRSGGRGQKAGGQSRCGQAAQCVTHGKLHLQVAASDAYINLLLRIGNGRFNGIDGSSTASPRHDKSLTCSGLARSSMGRSRQTVRFRIMGPRVKREGIKFGTHANAPGVAGTMPEGEQMQPERTAA
jgi:hypothetical protein